MSKPMPSNPDPLLAERAAAEYLALAPATLQRWRWAGRGPKFLRVNGRTIRYRKSDLDAFLDDARAA